MCSDFLQHTVSRRNSFLRTGVISSESAQRMTVETADE